MFKVYFYFNTNCIVNGTIKYLPRQGEKVKVNGVMYKVVDVVYLIENGASTTTEVVVRLEEF